MEAQIQHKVSAVQQLYEASPQAEIVLAGHSVGARICIEVMRRRPEFRVVQTHLLLPTVKFIADTPNGKFMTVWIPPTGALARMIKD